MRPEDAKIGMRVEVHPDAWKNHTGFIDVRIFNEGVIKRKAGTGKTAAIEFDHPIPDFTNDCHGSTKGGHGKYVLWENLKPVNYSEEGWAVVKSDTTVSHENINHAMIRLSKGDVGQIIAPVKGEVPQMVFFKTKHGMLKVPLIHLEDHPDVIERRKRERITTKPVTPDQAVKQPIDYDTETIDAIWRDSAMAQWLARDRNAIGSVSADILSGKSDLLKASQMKLMAQAKSYLSTKESSFQGLSGYFIDKIDKEKALRAVIARRRK